METKQINFEEKSSEELGLILMNLFRQQVGIDNMVRQIEAILQSRFSQPKQIKDVQPQEINDGADK